MGIAFGEFFNSYMPWDEYIGDKSWISEWTENRAKAKEDRKNERRNGMKTWDEFFSEMDPLNCDLTKENEKNMDAIQREINKRLCERLKERGYMTASEVHKLINESIFDKDERELTGKELDFREQQEIEELEEELECKVKPEKAPDPVKEEIFTTCLNFLHTHTEDELYEIVRLAFDAAEVFGY